MTFGALIIGDEILSGKRQDKHFPKIIETLKARGLELSWAQYLGDDRARLTETLSRTLKTQDIVLSFGGIGATPDDHTRQAAAAALGVPLFRHPEALAEIEARWGAEAYPKRVMMAEFPQGAEIVPNPYNRIAGFSVGTHFFFPGFPEMAWPMMEWVLDHRFAHLHRSQNDVDEAILVTEAGESQLIDLMNEVVHRYPELKLFSLPHIGESGRHIELGVRGAAAKVSGAMEDLRQGVTRLGFPWTPRAPLT